MSDTDPLARKLAAAIASPDAVTDDLVELVYDDLRSLAQWLLRQERVGHTLQPTALVNEAMLRLLPSEQASGAVKDRFLHLAARCMRRILVDHARQRDADKRGAGWHRVSLVDAESGEEDSTAVDLLHLDRALEQLEAHDPRMATIVELTYFGGLTGDQAAQELKVSRSTIKRELGVARIWLAREMRRSEEDAP